MLLCPSQLSVEKFPGILIIYAIWKESQIFQQQYQGVVLVETVMIIWSYSLPWTVDIPGFPHKTPGNADLITWSILLEGGQFPVRRTTKKTTWPHSQNKIFNFHHQAVYCLLFKKTLLCVFALLPLLHFFFFFFSFQKIFIGIEIKVKKISIKCIPLNKIYFE